MSEAEDLAREVILDHSRRPRNFRVLSNANRQAEGDNRLCGDRVQVWIDLQDGVIRDIAFQGSGCPISVAAASVMTEMVLGKTVAEAGELFDAYHAIVTGPPDGPVAISEVLGKLGVFAGVRRFPVRVKCATLAWHTLQAALKGQRTSITTES
ncbi:MAG: Fe-S cluster assembly sulfur transfer protein SufU [Bacillota bacterium]